MRSRRFFVFEFLVLRFEHFEVSKEPCLSHEPLNIPAFQTKFNYRLTNFTFISVCAYFAPYFECIYLFIHTV